LLKARMFLAFQRVKAMQAWTAEQIMDHFFQRQEIKALYNAILADFVVRPSQFQGLGIPMVNPEPAYDDHIPLDASKAGPRPGFYYVGGGMGKMVEALADAIRAGGGQIHTGAPVRRITVKKGGVTGIVLDDGHNESADVVLASGGTREAFFGLVGREHLPADFAAKVDNVAYMESVLMVHLGIDFDPTPYQCSALCYYYGTYDIEAGVEHCQQGIYHEGKDGFLIYVPSRHSPELAPPGHHAVTVYTIAPNHLSEGTWMERREELADKLLIEAEKIVPGLRERSQVSYVLTPDDFRTRTHQEHHSFGGAAPVIGKEATPNRTPIQGLWFIGSQSESGAGVPNVIAGTRKAIHRVLKEMAS
jgi:phytoene dehydrogenase-like protein